MEEREIKNLVKVWHEKAKEERDIFTKFVFLWFCFNAWLAYQTNEDTDRGMVECLKRKDPSVSDIVYEYDRAFGSGWFKERIQELKGLAPIDDPRGRRTLVNINDISNFDEICEAIYRIRCNLFHGGKTPSGDRDKKLVKVTGDILEKWVGNLVNSWRVQPNR
jgi:hypothetical protein